MSRRFQNLPRGPDNPEPIERLRVRHRLQDGFGLVGLLAALFLLGGLAAILLTWLPDSGTGSPGGLTASLPGLATQQPEAQMSAAAQQACLANYTVLQQAVSLYDVEHSSPHSNISELQTYFRGTLSTPDFTLTIDPNRPGQIEVQTKNHPAADGDGNCR